MKDVIEERGAGSEERGMKDVIGERGARDEG